MNGVSYCLTALGPWGAAAAANLDLLSAAPDRDEGDADADGREGEKVPEEGADDDEQDEEEGAGEGVSARCAPLVMLQDETGCLFVAGVGRKLSFHDTQSYCACRHCPGSCELCLQQLLCSAMPCCAVLCRCACCLYVCLFPLSSHSVTAPADVDAGMAGMADMNLAQLMQDDDLGADPETLIANLRCVFCGSDSCLRPN